MLKATNLYEQVYKYLKDQIYQGTFPVKEPIFETQLAEQLGISRTPVREALRMLESEALIEQGSGGGYRAISINAQDIEDAVEARIAIESLSVRLATSRMTPAQIADLFGIIERTKQALDAGLLGETMLENEAFHRYLAEVTGSRLLSQLLDRIYDYIKVNQVLRGIAGRNDSQTLMKTFYEEHLAIAIAIKDGKAEEAATLMQLHLSDIKLHYQSSLT